KATKQHEGWNGRNGTRKSQHDRSSPLALARTHAGANLHPVPAGGDRVRACAAWRPAHHRALGRSAHGLGLSAVSVRWPLSPSARRRHCRDGGAAREDHRQRTLSIYAQPDVSRPSHFPHRPHDHILVVACAHRACRSRALVPSPRAARRSAAREDIWRRLSDLSRARETLDPRSLVTNQVTTSVTAVVTTAGLEPASD